MIVTVLVFLVVLGVLVYVHEFGHYLLAKLNGVKVFEFAFGFRPRLWAKKIGETVYAINLIPLGGYVRLFGEDPKELGEGSFRSKTVFQRLQVMVAGVLMNLLLAWVILVALFANGFDPLMPGVSENPFVSATQSVNIVRIVEGSPAALAGMSEGDIITTVDGKKVATDQEFVAVVAAKRGQKVTLGLERDGISRDVTVEARENPPEGEGAIGVGIRSSGEVKSTLLASPAAATYETGRIVGLSAEGFGRFVKNLVFRGEVSEDVTGIIGVGALTGITRRLGFEYLVQLVAVVSIGLGVINLVPILPLDGGHILALGYEKIAGRPLSDRQLGMFAALGIAFVMLIFAIVTYKDIIRFDVIERLF